MTCFSPLQHAHLRDLSRSFLLQGKPKPLEFGGAGMNWQDVGWKINVNFAEMENKVRPKDHMGVLRAALPDRYSPLQATGNGNQGVYLTEVAAGLAQVLISLIGRQAAEQNFTNSSPNCAPQGLQILLCVPLYSIENTRSPASMNRLVPGFPPPFSLHHGTPAESFADRFRM